MEEMSAFERQLATRLQHIAGPEPVVDVSASVRAATTRAPKMRLLAMFGATRFATASVIVTLFGGFLLAGMLTTQRADELPPAGASPSPSPETEYTLTTFPNPAGFYRTSVATGDAIWGPGNPGVSRLDSVTNELTTVDLPGLADWWDFSLVATDDAIWVVDALGVTRIDRMDLTAQDWVTRDRDQPFVPLMSGYGGPIVADGSLWITSGEAHSLVEVDLAEAAIRDEYVDTDVWSFDRDSDLWLGATSDAIWVSSNDPDGSGRRLTRFDLGTRQYTDSIDDLPGDSGGISTGCCVVGDDDAIWLIDQRSVSRFDLATLVVTDTLGLGVQSDLVGGIATPGAVWVVDQADGDRDGGSGGIDGSVIRIDASKREITHRIDVGSSPVAPALLHGAVWVASHFDEVVSRIDIESRMVTDRVPIPKYADRPLASDGLIWIFTERGEMARIDLPVGGEPTTAPETE